MSQPRSVSSPPSIGCENDLIQFCNAVFIEDDQHSCLKGSIDCIKITQVVGVVATVSGT